MGEFANGYGGFLSFDDVVCLFQSIVDDEVPNNIPFYQDDEDDD